MKAMRLEMQTSESKIPRGFMRYWRERRTRRSSFVEGRRANWLCELARGLRYWQVALTKCESGVV